jgi:hypothetical protein
VRRGLVIRRGVVLERWTIDDLVALLDEAERAVPRKRGPDRSAPRNRESVGVESEALVPLVESDLEDLEEVLSSQSSRYAFRSVVFAHFSCRQ